MSEEDFRRIEALFARERDEADDPARRRAITDAALRRIRSQPRNDWRWLISRPVGALLAGTLAAGIVAGMLVEPPGEEVSAISVLLDEGVM